MHGLFKILRAPGARRGIEGAAPTQVVSTAGQGQEKDVDNFLGNVTTYAVVAKPRLLDRWLDKVVEVSGSEFVYFSIILAVVVWAFMGIPFGTSNTWQVLISDAQAIVNMVFDAFLMRQQLNSHESLVTAAACLRSRSTSNKRMLQQLIASGKYEKVETTQFNDLKQTDYGSELPTEDCLGRISTGLSAFMGHILTVCGFWVCIFIWIGFGKYCDWSDTWQLYINSSTSALMVFILAFLANIRDRHSKYMTKCLESIWEVDAALELKLRTATGDTMDNAPVVIPAPKRSRIQRGIDYYADLVGSLIGIAILIFVILVWIAIGPALHFDTNWWLLIGTYAGLVGLNDGFVLRNVFTVLGNYENDQFTQVEYEDMDMLAVIGVGKLKEERVADNSLTCRISVRMGDICSHELTVVLGAVSIIGLVIGASAMGWSVTGQLLCNVPPSIVESFFTMILITGHNIEDAKRRVDLHNIYLRRLKLVSYVDTFAKIEKLKPVGRPEQANEVVELKE
ncbi:putative low affinity iron transporter [Coniochaeta sp. PMI_546]|nr:putative low affinity iron transporter [Coniochaeta sp. PMI_546]